jgi:hypothetical protein
MCRLEGRGRGDAAHSGLMVRDAKPKISFAPHHEEKRFPCGEPTRSFSVRRAIPATPHPEEAQPQTAPHHPRQPCAVSKGEAEEAPHIPAPWFETRSQRSASLLTMRGKRFPCEEPSRSFSVRRAIPATPHPEEAQPQTAPHHPRQPCAVSKGEADETLHIPAPWFETRSRRSASLLIMRGNVFRAENLAVVFCAKSNSRRSSP